MSNSYLVVVSVNASLEGDAAKRCVLTSLFDPPAVVGVNSAAGGGALISVVLETPRFDEEIRDSVVAGFVKHWPNALQGVWIHFLDDLCSSWTPDSKQPQDV